MPPGLDLPRALAVGLTTVGALGLLPAPLEPGLDALADQLDAEAERNQPGHEPFMNPAKSLALRLADHTPLLWGTDPLAAAVAGHAAGALATHAGVVAHADDVGRAVAATGLLRALDRGAAGADIFHDPFDDADGRSEAPPLRLVLLATGEEDPAQVTLRSTGRVLAGGRRGAPGGRGGPRRAATPRCCGPRCSRPASTWPRSTWGWPPGPIEPA